MSQELVFQLGLSLIKGVGPVTAKKLIAYCGGYEAVFKEKISNLKKIPTIGGVLAKEIQKSTVLKRAEEEIKYIEKHKISVLSFWDSHYPSQLKQCVDAPILLFSKGNVDWNNRRIISVVGTRKASAYGLSMCKELIKELSPFSDSGDQNICDHNKNSCVDSPYDFNDMVENYMSYSNPSCQNIFTKGQMGLMHGVLANQRVDLPYDADNTVGIHANENFHFSVYPQPAKDLLHIELIGANSQSNL